MSAAKRSIATNKKEPAKAGFFVFQCHKAPLPSSLPEGAKGQDRVWGEIGSQALSFPLAPLGRGLGLGNYEPCSAYRPMRSLLRSWIVSASGDMNSAKSAASKTGRISISLSPSMGLGQRLTHSTASSRSRTSQIQ